MEQHNCIEAGYREIKDSVLELIRCKEYAIANGLSDNALPPLIWGEPGIGKSAMVKEIAEENGYEVIELRGSYLEPTDLIGIPYPDLKENLTKWLQSELIPFKSEAKGILFMDEINRSQLSVLNAFMEITLERSVKGVSIADQWQIIAAANPDTDNSGVEQMPDALLNRFTHYYVRPNYEDFFAYLTKTNADQTLRAFLSANPNFVYMKNNRESSLSSDNSYPTFRSWESVSQFLAYKKTQGELDIKSYSTRITIAGMIGLGAYTMLSAFADLKEKLPDIPTILRGGPQPVSKETAVQIYAAISLMDATTPAQIENVIKYIEKLSKEAFVIALSTLKYREDKRDFIKLKSVQNLFDRLQKELF